MSGSKNYRGVQCLLVIVGLNLWFLLQYIDDLPIGIDNSNFSIVKGTSVAINTTVAIPSQIQPFKVKQTPDPSRVTAEFQVFHDNIDHIRLLGERHSGTTYLTKYLQACFPDHPVNDFLVRKKHWFQPTPYEISQVVKAVDRDVLDEATEFKRFQWDHRSWWDIAQESKPQSMFQTSLVLYMVRDVFQWMEAMRQRPWHWPNHLTITPKNQSTITKMKYDPTKHGLKRRRRRRRLMSHLSNSGLVGSIPKGEKSGDILPGSIRIQKSFLQSDPLSWEEFVKAPLRLVDEEDTPKSAKICQKGFSLGTISPCAHNHSYVPPSINHIPRAFLRNLPFSVNDVIYELQPNGQAFRHPLDLRAAKIRNMLQIPHVWDLGGYALIRYEDILNGTDNATSLHILVEEIAHVLGIPNQCPEHKSIAKKPYELPEAFTDWIREHADWELESRLGYSRYH